MGPPGLPFVVVACFSFKTERTAREVPKKVKKTLCESSSFIKTDQHSIVFGIFFYRSLVGPLLVPLISNCSVLGASGVLLVPHVVSSELFWDPCRCFWSAFGVLCHFFWAVSGSSWACLRPFLVHLGLSWAHLCCSLAHPEGLPAYL